MFKKYVFPVFFFYIFTSILFLSLFSYFYFTQNKASILKNSFSLAKSFSSQIERIYKFEGVEALENLSEKYKISIYDMNNKLFLLKEFDPPKFKKNQNTIEINDDLYFQRNFKRGNRKNLHSHHARKNYKIYIKFAYPKAEILNLKIKLTIFFIGILLMITLFSYFILRLSYRPLIAQISHLNNFISDTTHEINSPLSVILMSIEMFDRNPKKYLKNIKISAKNLSNLYEDLSLNLQKNNDKNILENLNLKDIILAEIEKFSLLAENKNLNFKLDLADIKILSDKRKLNKIIDNLLSNAIKYSFKNSTISIKSNSSFIEIINEGEGIKKENLNKIFEKFSRFDNQNGGFGLGLSLVKRYCEELNYKISAQSENNLTKFSVKFN